MLASQRSKRTRQFSRRKYLSLFFVGILVLVLSVCSLSRGWLDIVSDSKPDLDKVQQCAIDNFHSDLSFLDTAVPIEAEEFIERRDRLARALVASGADAFVLEPGYTFQ